MARSLHLLSPQLTSYVDLRPLTVSVLPVANGCQARCAFCFSESSVSVEQRVAARNAPLSDERVREVLRAGRAAGAVRAVITGVGNAACSRLSGLRRSFVSAHPSSAKSCSSRMAMYGGQDWADLPPTH